MILDSYLVRDHLLIQLNGDILMDNSKAFYIEFDSIFKEYKDRIGRISFDFREVRFLDSSGIGAIIKATSKLKESNIQILVLNLNKTLQSVFRLSGLENILVVVEIREFVTQFPELKEYINTNNAN